MIALTLDNVRPEDRARVADELALVLDELEALVRPAAGGETILSGEAAEDAIRRILREAREELDQRWGHESPQR